MKPLEPQPLGFAHVVALHPRAAAGQALVHALGGLEVFGGQHRVARLGVSQPLVEHQEHGGLQIAGQPAQRLAQPGRLAFAGCALGAHRRIELNEAALDALSGGLASECSPMRAHHLPLSECFATVTHPAPESLAHVTRCGVRNPTALRQFDIADTGCRRPGRAVDAVRSRRSRRQEVTRSCSRSHSALRAGKVAIGERNGCTHERPQADSRPA